MVCGGAIEAPRFANAWEKSRGAFPCCSEACATRFDPDVHWLPARAPAPLDDAEARRLISIASRRLARGDLPRVVVREMLLAGVPVAPLRGALIEGRAATAAAERSARRWSIAGFVFAAFGASLRLAESRDPRDLAALDEGAAQLDRWQARFAPLDPR